MSAVVAACNAGLCSFMPRQILGAGRLLLVVQGALGLAVALRVTSPSLTAHVTSPCSPTPTDLLLIQADVRPNNLVSMDLQAFSGAGRCR